MNPKELAQLARAARRSGIITLLDLQIVAELYARGDATLQSFAHSFGISLETIAHACAGLETRKKISVRLCRENVGQCLVSLTPAGEEAVCAAIHATTPPDYYAALSKAF